MSQQISQHLDAHAWLEHTYQKPLAPALTPYSSRLDIAQNPPCFVRLGAVLYAQGMIAHACVHTVAFDFSQKAGSVGSTEGDALCDFLHLAARHGDAAVVIARSAGARLTEGLQGMLQMTRWAAARVELASAQKPLITLATDPTLGLVAAACLGSADVAWAVPDARLGLAGDRASAGQNQAPTVVPAQEACATGCIDDIVPVDDFPRRLRQVLAVLGR